eukprot:6112526-Amphidinium_carterae.1
MKEASAHQESLAMRSCGPEVQTCLADLAAGKTDADVFALEKLPQWQDMLPAAQTQPVADALVQFLTAAWEELARAMAKEKPMSAELKERLWKFIAKTQCGVGGISNLHELAKTRLKEKRAEEEKQKINDCLKPFRVQDSR